MIKQRVPVRACGLALAASVLLAACGGGGPSSADDPSAAGKSLSAEAAAEVASTAAVAASAIPAPIGIVVRASASLLGGVGPLMEVRADGVSLGSVEVRTRDFSDYVFSVPALAADARIDLIFGNDANRLDSEDRNLIVESLTVGGVSMSPTQPDVTYDVGTGAAATDGIGVIAGRSVMFWNGALRFPAPALDTRVVVHARGTAIDGAGPSMDLRIDGKLAARISVDAVEWQSYAFAVGPLVAGTTLDLVYTNDATSADGDRNLFIDSLNVSGLALSPSDPAVRYDVGSGSAAFDGLDVIPGRGELYWNGALRFALPTLPAPNRLPVPAILLPTGASLFAAGQAIAFSADATDAEDGSLPDAQLLWWVELHHDSHAHPFYPPTPGRSGSVAIPVRGETSDNIWYRFHLRATDSTGASVEITRDAFPAKIVVSLATLPAGLQLTLDGQPVSTPAAFTGVVGIERDLGAADQVAAGRQYRFSGWSDAGAAVHTIATPGAATTYTATFVDAGPAPGTTPTAPGEGTGTPTEPLPTALGVALAAPAALSADIAGLLVATASVSGASGAATVEFQLDGAALGSDDTAPYNWSIDTEAHASGQHVVRARARDTAGRVSAWSSSLVQFAGTRVLPQGFAMNEGWAGGFTSATAFAQLPDGRVLVCEQGGALRVVNGGRPLTEPLLRVAVDASGERGLLGVAVHPDFGRNGLVYVYYTAAQGGVHNRVSRFVLRGDLIEGGETVLLELPLLSSATIHNGGAMQFGTDGKLYVGIGDNASPTRAQDPADPFGKVLRLNDDGSIPVDNPFAATQTGLGRAVWALGLRNPFTMSVQPGTGLLYINDVGQDSWEEINLGAAGANYGWPGSEGVDRIVAGLTAPTFSYGHSAANPPGSGPGGFITGYAVVGGAFYPAGGGFPAPYRGSYFFADFVGHFIARLDADGRSAYTFGRVSSDPVGLLASTDGALLVLTRTGIARISAL